MRKKTSQIQHVRQKLDTVKRMGCGKTPMKHNIFQATATLHTLPVVLNLPLFAAC